MKTIYNLQFTIYKRGFTLIELLVVISIIGILSSFLLANFIGVRQRARDGVRKSDLRQIQSALELYRSDKGVYPLTASFPSCPSQFTDGAALPVIYMQKIPCDPSSGLSYYYVSDGTTYSVVACIENANDAQLENPPTACNPPYPAATWQYVLQNP